MDLKFLFIVLKISHNIALTSEWYSAIKKKEWNSIICYDTDETEDHYIKWNKSGMALF
jgi:hypothetical protein